MAILKFKLLFYHFDWFLFWYLICILSVRKLLIGITFSPVQLKVYARIELQHLFCFAGDLTNETLGGSSCT